jgi:hypothetical protein
MVVGLVSHSITLQAMEPMVKETHMSWAVQHEQVSCITNKWELAQRQVMQKHLSKR